MATSADSSASSLFSGLSGGGSSSAESGGGSTLDYHAKKKLEKKKEKEKRKQIRKEKRKVIQLYTREEQIINASKKKDEARRRGNVRKLLLVNEKKKYISYDSLTSDYSKYKNVSILLDMCKCLILTEKKSNSEIEKTSISPKWYELLATSKYVLPPSDSITYKKKLFEDGLKMRKVKRIIEPSQSSWVSVNLFFAINKLILKFNQRKQLNLKHVETINVGIIIINKLIKEKNDFSPRLQIFFDLLGVPPTIVISRAHIPIPKALIGIADRSPLQASLFPTELPFDGKLKSDCGICFNLDSEPALKLICGHIFHTDCINPWLIKDRTCATCRHPC